MDGLLQEISFKEGTYEIESVRRGYGLELAVDFTRMAGGPRGFGQPNNEPIKPVPAQELADVIKNLANRKY
jgi:arabinan endo-1,5-alpha-L-arabinosidase